MLEETKPRGHEVKRIVRTLQRRLGARAGEGVGMKLRRRSYRE